MVGQNIRRMANAIAFGGVRAHHDVEAVRKIAMLNIISIIAILNLIPFGIAAVYAGKTALAYLDIVTGIILIFAQIHLRKTGEHTHSMYLGVTAAGLLFLYLFLTGGVENTGHLWFFTFPLFSSFLLGAKRGAIGTSVLVLIVIVYCIFVDYFSLQPIYSKYFKARFFMSFLVVFAYSYVFESLRKSSQEQIELWNTELEEKVNELGIIKKELQESHDKLEKRVEERTADLINSNFKLRKEIKVRRNAEKALRESEGKLKAMLASISDYVTLIDRDLNIIWANETVKEIFGDNSVGKKCYEVFQSRTIPCEPNPCIVQKVFQDGKIHECETQKTTGKGETRYFNCTANTALRDNEGIATSVMEISRDITKQKNMENELKASHEKLEKRVSARTRALTISNEHLLREISYREIAQREALHAKEIAEKASKTKSEFLANMSHELRTPMNHIIGFTELVVDKNFGELNETQSDYLGDVLESSNHLLYLINDILDLSKVEAGKMGIEVSDINLKSLLSSSLNMVKAKALKDNIQLSSDFDGIPDMIKADERRLKQILYNLLSNSVKFSPSGGSIMLKARRLGSEQDRMKEANRDEMITPSLKGREQINRDYIKISIIDSGIGIKKADLKRIFYPFEQIESSMNRKYNGTGLGLALTKSMVELHKGRIWAKSAGLGKGSQFNFTIPV